MLVIIFINGFVMRIFVCYREGMIDVVFEWNEVIVIILIIWIVVKYLFSRMSLENFE